MISLVGASRAAACGLALLFSVAIAADKPANSPPPRPQAVATPAPSPIDPDQVLAHVKQTVDWYHDLEGLQQVQTAAEDVIARDRLRQQSIMAVALAFDFGRAAAKVPSNTQGGAGSANSRTSAPASANAPANGSPPNPNTDDDDNSPDSASSFANQIDQASDRLGQRVTMLQSQLADIDQQLARTRGTKRDTLEAQRGAAQSALTLTKTILGSVQDMQRFQESTLSAASGQSGLSAQLTDLERTVPEVASVQRKSRGTSRDGTGATSAAAGNANGAGGSSGQDGASGSSATASGPGSVSPATAATPSLASAHAPDFQPETAGVITLATQWFSLHNSRSEIDDSIKRTNKLSTQVQDVRSKLTAAVRSSVRGALDATSSTDAAQLAAQKAALDAGATHFKQLSTLLVPIAEQGLTLESVENDLLEWRDSLNARNGAIARYLALRLGLMIASVVVVLAVSEIWRRATFRYLHDTRRRRQFLVLRRVIVGVALTIVIVFGLVSEIGSIATYAGFVTAGIAVALQNVILAIVAYFFLIGRFGVRVGDRVTLAGVTGRVVDIGLVRLYLMELAGPELHSTGRMVVLSNAVLFQPTAMFKQIPGADYAWHTATLTLSPMADIAQAHERLKAAADEVYAKYRKVIDRQHEAVQRFIDFDTTAPQPEVRVRWAESGLECVVRYPVEPENSASVDQQMLKALRAALEKDPALSLVQGSAVVVKEAG
ncbi:MAG TPA: mechanosensitive ion channel family protein [Steroidobacteraceae bacterium]